MIRLSQEASRRALMRSALGAAAGLWAAGPTVGGVEADIRGIVRGGSSPEAIAARARAHASEYLAAFDRLYLAADLDLNALSNGRFASLLGLLAPVEPDRARAAAERLVRRYGDVLFLWDAIRDRRALSALVPESAMRRMRRLETRRAEVRALLAR